MNYLEALDWIHSIGRFGIKPGLARMSKMMELLGNPQKKIKVIHIAGTNGKGSTAAFLSKILEEAGYSVGLYTSPYLEAFTNRMAINGNDIPEDRLVEIVNIVKPMVDDISKDFELGQMTEFEVVTCIAFYYFAAQDTDFVVLEVGLGGRLDATNVVENPLVSVITNIGLEHTEVLGDTIEKIAGEKAGIIKEGAPVVTAVPRPEAMKVIQKKCQDKNAHLFVLRESVNIEIEELSLNGQSFHYVNPQGLQLKDLFISLLGEHQIINASTAVAVIEILQGKGFHIPEAAVRKGLKAARWAGRLELMGKDPLLILDAAHNLDGVRSLKKALQDQVKYEKLVLVIGILGDKALDEMLKEIIPLADKIIITKPDSPRAAEPEAVADVAEKYARYPMILEDSIPRAVNIAMTLAEPEDLVLICGSLYTISEARKAVQRLPAL
ncbi:bifunctional folylpolyglutamate synthase/dihydrofolate synthase [Candidatus Contubernalis alkaliaceticus]|uniref:bifunctional folylpolyglutamate synthase/dihydrofolate synthase n=1 Tax=Candidatus Contubernalis alkaliaceticus TaxID=338645 RepID=UPI001F4C4C64|nr:folylpolyglutamate synthase/dihydrofolate synthase family protein [Candidatus Contubernalis alkalaceticus]UNC90899.1 bifunctional folylpolyglutamate synthase/dihydrofolate synthase [Candidatus Contubernalis alkalaceticus]